MNCDRILVLGARGLALVDDLMRIVRKSMPELVDLENQDLLVIARVELTR